jgi:large subunit ribosomal protein L37Ae
MVEKTKLGSARRFMTRYGRTVKHKFAAIDALQKQKHACPYCKKNKIIRLFSGVWECKKCGTKFTGKAYLPYQNA